MRGMIGRGGTGSNKSLRVGMGMATDRMALRASSREEEETEEETHGRTRRLDLLRLYRIEAGTLHHDNLVVIGGGTRRPLPADEAETARTGATLPTDGITRPAKPCWAKMDG